VEDWLVWRLHALWDAVGQLLIALGAVGLAGFGTWWVVRWISRNADRQSS
jgi:hypothetical protein